MPALAVAHLEVIHAKLTRQVAGRLLERRAGHLVCGDDAAIDAEWRGNQCVAEKEAPDLRERQHTADLSIALGKQVVRAMTKGTREHILPFGEVEERTFRVSVDERVPGRAVGFPEWTDRDSSMPRNRTRPQHD